MEAGCLSKLQKGKHRDPVCVRVIRKWTVKEKMGQGDPLCIGLVLVDAKVKLTNVVPMLQYP